MIKAYADIIGEEMEVCYVDGVLVGEGEVGLPKEIGEKEGVFVVRGVRTVWDGFLAYGSESLGLCGNYVEELEALRKLGFGVVEVEEIEGDTIEGLELCLNEDVRGYWVLVGEKVEYIESNEMVEYDVLGIELEYRDNEVILVGDIGVGKVELRGYEEIVNRRVKRVESEVF